VKLIKSGNVIWDDDLREKVNVFKDRIDAGRKLAEACKLLFKNIDIVYAIPRGGVPVGYEVAKTLNSQFDLLICRKLLIPWNREAGFGAIDPDGNVYVDDEFASYLGLSELDIKNAINEQLNEIRNRNRVLRGDKPYPNLDNKSIILVDDGIAAGYTMEVAIKFVKGRGASEVIIATPTGSLSSVMRLAKQVNYILCLNIRSSRIFAVADAYIKWRDLTDKDIMIYLR